MVRTQERENFKMQAECQWKMIKISKEVKGMSRLNLCKKLRLNRRAEDSRRFLFSSFMYIENNKHRK